MSNNAAKKTAKKTVAKEKPAPKAPKEKVEYVADSNYILKRFGRQLATSVGGDNKELAKTTRDKIWDETTYAEAVKASGANEDQQLDALNKFFAQFDQKAAE